MVTYLYIPIDCINFYWTDILLSNWVHVPLQGICIIAIFLFCMESQNQMLTMLKPISVSFVWLLLIFFKIFLKSVVNRLKNSGIPTKLSHFVRISQCWPILHSLYFVRICRNRLILWILHIWPVSRKFHISLHSTSCCIP